MAAIPSKAVGRTNASFALLRNQMPGIIDGSDRERISCAVRILANLFEWPSAAARFYILPGAVCTVQRLE